MIIIGLTGPTGAGKSTVAEALREKGCFVIDADEYARRVMAPGSPVLGQLAACFGGDILSPADGSLIRPLLAKRAFSSPENTKKLNDITHPAITREIFDTVRAAAEKGFDICVIDAAALRESGIMERCDAVVAVTAPLAVRLHRILSRDDISLEAAMQRINAQKNEEYYSDKADMIIVNDSTESLEAGLLTLKSEIDLIRERNANDPSKQ